MLKVFVTGLLLTVSASAAMTRGFNQLFDAVVRIDVREVAFEDGAQTRDFVHVTDVARAFHLAVESDADGAALNVCTGQPSSVVDVAQSLAKGLDLSIEPEIVGKYRAGDIRHCIGDPQRAADLLEFRAEMEVGTGLGQLAEWLAGQEADDRVEQAMAELRQRGLER